MRIALRQDLDDDLPLFSCAQHGVNRRQTLVEPNIHDAAADRDDGSDVR
jgi:hypothetical protein